jgi:hypothetical protein
MPTLSRKKRGKPNLGGAFVKRLLLGGAVTGLVFGATFYFVDMQLNPPKPIVKIHAPKQAWADSELTVVASVEILANLPGDAVQKLVLENKDGTKTVALSHSNSGKNTLRYSALTLNSTSIFHIEVISKSKDYIFKSKRATVQLIFPKLPKSCNLPLAKKKYGVVVRDSEFTSSDFMCGAGEKTFIAFTESAYNRYPLQVFYDKIPWADWSSGFESSFVIENQMFLYRPYPLVHGYYIDDPAKTLIRTNYHGIIVSVVSTISLAETKRYLKEALANISTHS